MSDRNINPRDLAAINKHVAKMVEGWKTEPPPPLSDHQKLTLQRIFGSLPPRPPIFATPEPDRLEVRDGAGELLTTLAAGEVKEFVHGYQLREGYNRLEPDPEAGEHHYRVTDDWDRVALTFQPAGSPS